MASWGMDNLDMTYIRREMRTLLLKYVTEGDARVDFD
jgi:hypothetical protein